MGYPKLRPSTSLANVSALIFRAVMRMAALISQAAMRMAASGCDEDGGLVVVWWYGSGRHILAIRVDELSTFLFLSPL
eukprot:scaffold103782_cov30-Tisochrysis_lutea.AAC.2